MPVSLVEQAVFRRLCEPIQTSTRTKPVSSPQYVHRLSETSSSIGCNHLMKRDFQFTKSVTGENWEKPRTAHWNYESAVEFETAKDFGMRIGRRKWKKIVEPDGD